VPNLMWSWQQAAAVALLLLIGRAALARRSRAPRVRPFLREAALVVALYAFWQLAGALADSGTYAAMGRGAWIWRTERSAHLPCECTLQAWILPHPVLVQAANLYYAGMHFPVTIALLVWLFVRHRDVYGRWRTTLALLTAACLAVQLIAVAPPRMVPQLGMIDTAVRYGQSVYGKSGGFDPDQLSAMPSVHIGWAVLVAVCLCSAGRSRWRYVGVGHAVLTVFVVLATGNHYWADGIVAVALLAAALVAQAGARGVVRQMFGVARPETEPVVGRLVLPARNIAGAALRSSHPPARLSFGEAASMAPAGLYKHVEGAARSAALRPGESAERDAP